MDQKTWVVPLKLEIAQPADAAVLAKFVNLAYRGDESRKGWTTEADLLDGQRTDPQGLQEMIETPGQVILFEREKSVLRGCVFLKRRQSSAYLGMLTVSPGLQAAGLGRQLLASAEAFVRDEWSLRKIEMTVISRRLELIAWYVRRGYQLTERRESFPYGNEKFGLPKVEDLEFVVLEKAI